MMKGFKSCVIIEYLNFKIKEKFIIQLLDQ